MSIRIRIYPQYGYSNGYVRDAIFTARRRRAYLARQQSMIARQQASLLQQRLRYDSMRVSDPFPGYSTFGPGYGYAAGIAGGITDPYVSMPFFGQPFGGFMPARSPFFASPFSALFGSNLLTRSAFC